MARRAAPADPGALVSRNAVSPDAPLPAPSDGLVARPRLVAQLSAGRRVALVVAPPGYGKTVLVRHWVAAMDVPAAWLSLDLLDADPTVFWTHVVDALRGVVPGIDDEPGQLLAERGGDDLVHLGALVRQIEDAARPAVLVLDDLGRIERASVLGGLAVLVERVGHLLRLVITSRTDMALPVARWRTAGWLTEVREADLRLTDDEAADVAEAYGGRGLDRDELRRLNARLEGWPIGLQLALALRVEGAGSPLPAATAATQSGRSDDGDVAHERLLADYLVGEVLGRLPARERDAALALSVLEWFDAEMALAVVGDDAMEVVDRLRRRRLFLTALDPGGSTMRFHALFRELLEAELGWRDPRRRVELHRRAAAAWRDRGDLNAAYRHLVAIGALEDARDLVVQPAMDLVDRGDHVGLARFMRTMPKALHVDDAHLALDLAVAWFFAGHGTEAERWCDRAEELDGEDPTIRLRLHTTRCMAALMRGELRRAEEHVDGFLELNARASSSNPIDQRFATTAARVALASGDMASAARWVAEAREIEGPSTVVEVTVPALEGWYELSAGRLDRATALAIPASERAVARGVRPHHGAFDALVVAGWCQVAAGRLAEAAELAEAAQTDADALGFVWNRVRAGALMAEVRRLTVGPLAALAQVRDLRASIGIHDHPPLLAVLDRVEALALLASGRVAEAAATIGHGDGAGALLVRAYVAWRERRAATAHELDDLLGDRRSWSRPDHLGAEILVGAADVSPVGDARLRAALDEAVATGWYWPFLGLAHDVAGRVRAVAIEHRHADVLRAMDGPAARARRTAGPSEPLTTRELTVLELLPTHLSYAQIGARLFVSVNTVKTNLKSIYRKLGVSSRSEAVAIARDTGLL